MAPRNNKCYAAIVSGREYIVDTWQECKELVADQPNTKYRGFKHRRDAALWLALEAQGRGEETAPRYFYAVHMSYIKELWMCEKA